MFTPERGGHLGEVVAVALLIFCANGCCSAPPSQFPTAEDALDRMKATYQCANGVAGQGKIDHFSPKGRVKGNVVFTAVNPDRVRFEVLSSAPIDIIYTLTSNGRDFKMLDKPNKQFLYGPASACNLARLTQVPVPGHVLVSLLRGEAPLLVHQPHDADISWSSCHYEIGITGKHQARQVVHLEVYEEDWNKPWEQQRVRVTRLITEQQGIVLYDASMDDHKLAHTAPPRVDEDGLDPDIPPSGGVCDVLIPTKLRMTVPYTDDDVVFEYKEKAFNPPIIEGAFDQQMPGGVSKVYVECKDPRPTGEPGNDGGAPPARQ